MRDLQLVEDLENEVMCMLCKTTRPMWAVHKCAAMLPRYEYKRTTDWEDVEKLGGERWELVSSSFLNGKHLAFNVIKLEYGDRGVEIEYYLKREITE
jgi:hypothetical protein